MNVYLALALVGVVLFSCSFLIWQFWRNDIDLGEMSRDWWWRR